MEILNGESELFTITKAYKDSKATSAASQGGCCQVSMSPVESARAAAARSFETRTSNSPLGEEFYQLPLDRGPR